MVLVDENDSVYSATPTAVLNKSFESANFGGNPTVNLAIGRLSYSFNDVATGYGDFQINVSHIYNSKMNALFTDKITGVGIGWKLNLHLCLVKRNNVVYFLDALGETHKFVSFDTNRYYDEQNAKTVLYYTDNEKYITDGVGNKLYFNSNGMISNSVSCHNASIKKVFEYDENNRLIKVYDERTVINSHPKNYVSLVYNENGLLSVVTAIKGANTNPKEQFKMLYSYNSSNELIEVAKVSCNNTQTVQLLSFDYSASKLTKVVNSRTNQAYQFTYNADNLVTKIESGLMVLQTGDSARLFTSKKSNTFAYTLQSTGISSETDIVNENGITLAYFLNSNGIIVSQFEKVNGELRTLTKQGSKRTEMLVGSSTPKINQSYSKEITTGSWTLPLANFSPARNKTEESLQTFEYAFWLKHSYNYPRMRAKVQYVVNSSTYTSAFVEIDGTATNAWQRVSMPISLPLDSDNKPISQISSISVTLMAFGSKLSGKIYVSEIGFAPMPISNTLINYAGTAHNLCDLKQVKINGSFVSQDNSNETGTYFNESDLLSTYVLYYSNPSNAGGYKNFDVICNNGTKRIANAHTFDVNFADSSTLISLPASLCTEMQTTVPDSKIIAQYQMDNSGITVTKIGSAQAEDGSSITSQSVAVTDYQGKTISEVDEYGVATKYTYDEYGRIRSKQLCSNFGTENELVETSFYYFFDNEGRLVSTNDNNVGQQMTYNDLDMPHSVCETTGASENNIGTPTGYSVQNSFGDFADELTEVKETFVDTENNSTTLFSRNTISYQDGRIRTVSDGAVKYGVQHNLEQSKTDYSCFDSVNSSVERIIQSNSISDFEENDDDIVVQVHKSKYFDEQGQEIDHVATDVDIYGQIQTVRRSGPTNGKVDYYYDNIKESQFAATPSGYEDAAANRYVSYNYDYDGNLTGWSESEKESSYYNQLFEIKQLSADTTKYSFQNDYELFVNKQYDANKIIAPRLTSVRFFEDNSGNYDNPTLVHYQNCTKFDNLGNVTKKEYDGGTNNYEYAKIGGKCFVQNFHNRHIHGQIYNQFYSNCQYNSNGTLKQVEHVFQWRNSLGSNRQNTTVKKAYEYNAAHQITRETDVATGRYLAYNYNTDGKLISVECKNPQTSTTEWTVARTYNDKGQLVGMNRHYAPPEEEYDESISFQYDNFGNRISKTGDTVQRYYTYNYGNKLTKVGATPATHFAQYTYNVDGVRCQKQVGNKITKYFLDGNKILKEVRTPSQQYSADTLKYLYDDDGLFMLVTNSDTYKYVRDQFNNVVLLLSQNYDTIARYEYDAHGKCTVYNAQNQVDTDPESIGNLNPFRWKSFYYDTESGLYYANGSYYDPQTGLYLDASPIESVLDNAFLPRGIDRNAPLCNNILELESNPFTMETTAKLAPDTSYDPTEGLPWWIRARNWIRQALYDVEMFFNKIPIGIRLLLGTFLLMLSIALTIETGGGGAEILELLAQAVIGVGLAAASYLVSGLFGNKLSWNGLANVAANAFLVTSATIFISSCINTIQYFARANNVVEHVDEGLTSYELDPRSIELAKQGNPSWSTFRKRLWQYEAELRPKFYGDTNVKRMLKGCAPLDQTNKPLHLHHILGKSVDMYNVIIVTSRQHTAIHKVIGYHVNRPKLPWTLENAIKYGGLS